MRPRRSLVFACVALAVLSCTAHAPFRTVSAGVETSSEKLATSQGQAEAAMNFYVSLFPEAAIIDRPS